jgi:hypothetical protein
MIYSSVRLAIFFTSPVAPIVFKLYTTFWFSYQHLSLIQKIVKKSSCLWFCLEVRKISGPNHQQKYLSPRICVTFFFSTFENFRNRSEADTLVKIA